MPVGARFSIIPTRPVTGVGEQLDFDATTSRTRERMGQAIRHPKESGSEGLVDDVNLDEPTISVTGHFTDFPLYAPGFEGRSVALVAGLRAVHEAKVPCTVIYGDDILTMMVLERMSEPRTAETGDACDVDFTMVQIEIGELKLVDAVADAQTKALGDITDIGWLP